MFFSIQQCSCQIANSQKRFVFCSAMLLSDSLFPIEVFFSFQQCSSQIANSQKRFVFCSAMLQLDSQFPIQVYFIFSNALARKIFPNRGIFPFINALVRQLIPNKGIFLFSNADSLFPKGYVQYSTATTTFQLGSIAEQFNRTNAVIPKT